MSEQADDRPAESPPPAPRGSSPKEPQRPRFGLSPRWIAFFLVLLALNLFLTTRAMEPESRVRVPYSPFFLAQVNTGNVRRSRRKGRTSRARLRRKWPSRTNSPRHDSGRRFPRSRIPRSYPSSCRRTTSRSTPSPWTEGRRGGRRCCSALGRRSSSSSCSSGSSAGPATCRTPSARSDGHAPAATSRRATGSRSRTSPASRRRRTS